MKCYLLCKHQVPNSRKTQLFIRFADSAQAPAVIRSFLIARRALSAHTAPFAVFRARAVHSFTSTLQNGVRVNSATTLPSPTVAHRASFLNVSVRAGCRHETDATAGSLAFFERILHLSTVHKSSRQVLQALKAHALNANVQCTVQRECLHYTIEIDAKHTISALNDVSALLADIVLRPVFGTHQAFVAQLRVCLLSICAVADQLLIFSSLYSNRIVCV